MKKILLVGSILLIGLVGAGFGADAGKNGKGVLYGGFGTVVDEGDAGSALFHPGVGGDFLFSRNLGLTIDIGYLAPFESLGSGIGVLNPGLFVSFKPESKTAPFVSGGYALFFREGSASGIFFGGGVDHWIGERWGIRVEARDNVMVDHNAHYLEGRIGILFR